MCRCQVQQKQQALVDACLFSWTFIIQCYNSAVRAVSRLTCQMLSVIFISTRTGSPQTKTMVAVSYQAWMEGCTSLLRPHGNMKLKSQISTKIQAIYQLHYWAIKSKNSKLTIDVFLSFWLITIPCQHSCESLLNYSILASALCPT